MKSFIGKVKHAIDHPDKLVFYLKTRTNPLKIAARHLAAIGYPLNANDKEILNLKNKHKGKRCFIVATGPSLKIEDLEKLKNEITISSNRIYVAFEDSDWRPTYYTIFDRDAVNKYIDQISKIDSIKLFPDFVQSIVESKKLNQNGKNLYFTPLTGKYDSNGNYEGYFSNNVLYGLHQGFSITVLNLQLAYHLGCNPIYILGLDGNYDLSKNKIILDPVLGELYESEDEKNYFHRNYRNSGDKNPLPNIEGMNIGYKRCNEFLRKEEIKVFNVSRKTHVNIFERANFNELIENKSL